jgi:hypothetical protein
VKIQDIQNDSMPGCDPTTPEGCVELKLKGVVVTAIDAFGTRTGEFWVQEPEGGEYSGVLVFGAPLDQVSALQIGDIVDLAGVQKTEFVYTTSSGTKSLSLTELEPVEGGTITVTKVMSGTPLEPTVVDALAIGQKPDYMARHAEWEKWEGVLVKVNNVQAFSDQECIMSMGSCPDTTYQNFDVTGDVVVQSSLAAMPSTEVAYGDCMASVTGVVGSFFDYYIMPRTTAEIATGGTSCPTENAALTCEDGIDNDGNGFKDCSDNNCLTASATCRTVTTIEAIQTAATPPTGGVELQGVYVVAKQRVTGTQKPRNMWVSTNPTAAASQGLLVYGNTSTDLSAYAIGSRVNVVGTIKEFNDGMNVGTGTLTELSLASHSQMTATTTPIVPVTNQTAAALSVDATGELYESVLVTLTNVEITAVGNNTNFYVGTMQQVTGGGTPVTTTFKYDDDIFRIAAGDVVGTCYASITGIWSYQVYDNAWYFLPIAAGTTAGGSCP